MLDVGPTFDPPVHRPNGRGGFRGHTRKRGIIMIDIKVTAPKQNRSMTITYDFGDDLASMVKRFGDTVVYNAAVDAMKIALQGFVRNRLARTGDNRMSDEAIRKDKDAWKPGTRTVSRDPVKKMAKLSEAVKKLTEDEKAEIARSMGFEYKPAKPTKK
jgi:hypothetical protein